MSELNRAAERALERLGAVSPRGGETISRLVVEVEIAGRTEIVTFVLKDGTLRWSSTEAEERNPFVVAALRWLAGRSDIEGRVSMRAAARSEPAMEAVSGRGSMAVALEDLVTSVVRTGVGDAHGSPTVEDAVARLLSMAPKPTPLGLSRWLGRLEHALEDDDGEGTVRLLEGAAKAVDDLRDASPSFDVRNRAALWRGTDGGAVDALARLTDRTVVEIAREVVQGHASEPILRRYLVCLHTGEVFREDGPRPDAVLSVGPCPRKISIGLADLEAGTSPRALRVLQYTVSHDVTQHDWLKVQRLGHARFTRVVADYKRAIRENPGLAEPFAVITPARMDLRQGAVLLDQDGNSLPVARAEDPAAAQVFDELVAGATPAWVAGRLVDAEGQLMVVPLSVGVVDATEIRHRRLS